MTPRIAFKRGANGAGPGPFDRDRGHVARAASVKLSICGWFPAAAVASDYSPLYFLFLELPVFIASCLFFALCFAAPMAGAVLCGLLFVATFLVIALWAGNELPFLTLTLLINIAGIFVVARDVL